MVESDVKKEGKEPVKDSVNKKILRWVALALLFPGFVWFLQGIYNIPNQISPKYPILWISLVLIPVGLFLLYKGKTGWVNFGYYLFFVALSAVVGFLTNIQTIPILRIPAGGVYDEITIYPLVFVVVLALMVDSILKMKKK